MLEIRFYDVVNERAVEIDEFLEKHSYTHCHKDNGTCDLYLYVDNNESVSIKYRHNTIMVHFVTFAGNIKEFELKMNDFRTIEMI